MLKVIIPLDHSEERQYIVNILFAEFLGLNFTIIEADTNVTSIQLENGNTLEINDAFFSRLNAGKNYLSEKNIPSNIFSLNLKEHQDDSPEESIIGLYGKPEISFSDKKISCGIDIFASAFFMLTRWEEYVIKSRDDYERFPEHSSLAYKHNFLDRPIVNEYVEVLWHWLQQLGIEQNRKVKKFEFINTHDIDSIKLFEKKHHYIAKVAKAFLVEKSLTSLWHHAKLAIRSLKGNDPYLMFNYFMDISEKAGIKSHFFFMAANKKTDFDNGYDIFSKPVQKIIKNIRNRGHIIGIHPSYYTLNTPPLLHDEINRLRNISDTEVICGRQHYLRFDLPNTWQHWEDNGMQWDSSLAYSQQEGFRCGVCYSFPVFNILSKKMLKLREIPLTIMDVTLIASNGGRTPNEAKKILNQYIEIVMQYSGDFVFLWHNSSFSYLIWKDYKQVFENAFIAIRKH